MGNCAFVEFVFSKKVGDDFSKIIKEIIPETSLYSSPVAEYVRGDMSGALHCIDKIQVTLVSDFNKRASEKDIK